MFSESVIPAKMLTACRWLAILSAIFAPISTAVTSVSCALMVAAWLCSGEAIRSLKISAEQAAGKMILVFYVWLFVGCLYADTTWAIKLDTLLSWKKLLYTFLLFGLFYEAKWHALFAKSFFNAMLVCALFATFLWATDWIIRPGYGRTPGIFMTNYSTQSMAFIAASLCSIFLLKQGVDKRKKWLLIGAIVLFAFNIFFISGARSGFVAYPFAVVFALCCIYGFKKLPHVVAVMAILLTVIIMTSTNVQKRIEKGFSEKETYQTSEKLSSIGARVVFAQNTWALIKERPIFGYGTSSFKDTYAPYVASKFSDWRSKPTTDPHNQYLFVWLENGAVGLLLFFAYIATAVRQGIKHPLYGGMAASFLIAVCASSLFNSHFKTFGEGHLLAFFVGMLLAQYKPVAQESVGALQSQVEQTV